METVSVPALTTAPPEAEFFCPRCGYSLRGIQSERCPECGIEIDHENLARSRIPWVHRRQIGRVRAYWRTVWRVSLHPIRFAEERVRPVSYSDARRFWLVTALLLSIPAGVAWAVVLLFIGEDFKNELMLAAGAAMVYASPIPTSTLSSNLWLPVGVAFTSLWVPALCLFLFLLMATGAPSFLAHPKRLPVVKQNRAVALSHYGAAPLAWLILVALPIGGLLLLTFKVVDSYNAFLFGTLIFAMSAVLFSLPLVGCWMATAWLVGLGTDRSGWGVAGVALVAPFIWLLSALVCFVALPWSIGLILLIVSRS